MHADAPLRPIFTIIKAFHDVLGNLDSATPKALWVSDSPADGIKHAGGAIRGVKSITSHTALILFPSRSANTRVRVMFYMGISSGNLQGELWSRR